MIRLLLLFAAIIILSGCSTTKSTNLDNGLDEFRSSYNWKRPAMGAGLACVSGATWGLHETLVHHYSRFDARFPNAKQDFWNPQYSWRNKYKQGNPDLGPAYLGSTTFLAWTTDAKHLAGSLHRQTVFFSAVAITFGERRPLWHYLLDAGISFVGFSIGFHSVYSWYF